MAREKIRQYDEVSVMRDGMLLVAATMIYKGFGNVGSMLKTADRERAADGIGSPQSRTEKLELHTEGELQLPHRHVCIDVGNDTAVRAVHTACA